MKHSYFKSFVVVICIFFTAFGMAQNSLSDSNYGAITQDYLNQKKESLGLTVTDISDLTVNNEYFSKKTKITHVYLNQRFQGISIFNAISSVAIKDNAVFYYANKFIGNIAERVNTGNPQISAEESIMRAASALNLGAVQGLDLIDTKGIHNFVFSDGSISKVNIPVELVYYPTQAGNLMLAWDLSIHTINGQNWYSVRIDAVSGDILNQTDWIVSCNFGNANHTAHNHGSIAKTSRAADFSLFKKNSLLVDGSQYNVFAIPTESPNHGGRTLLSEPAHANASPYGWHDVNGSAGEEYTITRGNNVWAQEDRDANDGTGFSPDGTATLNFDFPLNINQEPALYEDVSVTNLFYMNNIMHDVWYEYGFDEVSGNFQQNNYGNGGAGNDFVFADGQDGDGLNNASFGTPPDGGNPGMTMYLWSEPNLKELITINNGSLAGGVLSVQPAVGVGNNITGASTIPVTADMVVVNDGTAAPTEGCSPLTNGSSVAGKIAVIKRGNCPFVDKIQNAQDAGAVGVIVVNHNNPTNDPAYVPYVNMAGESIPPFTIPSVFVNNPDGEEIISALEGGEVLNATLQDYDLFQLDGSFDNAIVAHEYGHGISNRLTGGPSQSNCLQNVTQMGEGWSDFFALMLVMTAEEDFEDGHGFVTYASGQTTDGVGIRNAKYSTNFAVNDFTYADTNNAAEVSQPHGIGFVWATMLYDLAHAYIEKYGFDEDIYNGTGGNNKVMQLVMDGLKIQPCSPNFINGRDAILAADMALTGGEDQCLIWEVFAARGLGINADAGLPFSRSDQVEDFTTPPDTDPSLANCTSLSVDEFRTSDYKVYPNPTNNKVYIKTTKSFGEVMLTITDLNGRQVLAKQVDLFGTVEVDMSQLQSGIYILNMKGQNMDSNNKIIKN